MDRDYGSKPGSGGVLSESRANVDRRERLKQLAMEVMDLSKDPYFMKNHLGSYECKLCLTLHNNEGNYLAHTQGKKHKTNLARRGMGNSTKYISSHFQGYSFSFFFRIYQRRKIDKTHHRL